MQINNDASHLSAEQFCEIRAVSQEMGRSALRQNDFFKYITKLMTPYPKEVLVCLRAFRSGFRCEFEDARRSLTSRQVRETGDAVRNMEFIPYPRHLHKQGTVVDLFYELGETMHSVARIRAGYEEYCAQNNGNRPASFIKLLADSDAWKNTALADQYALCARMLSALCDVLTEMGYPPDDIYLALATALRREIQDGGRSRSRTRTDINRLDAALTSLLLGERRMALHGEKGAVQLLETLRTGNLDGARKLLRDADGEYLRLAAALSSLHRRGELPEMGGFPLDGEFGYYAAANLAAIRENALYVNEEMPQSDADICAEREYRPELVTRFAHSLLAEMGLLSAGDAGEDRAILELLSHHMEAASLILCAVKSAEQADDGVMRYGKILPADLPKLHALMKENSIITVSASAALSGQSVSPAAMRRYPDIRERIGRLPCETHILVYLHDRTQFMAMLFADYGDNGDADGFGVEPDIFLYAPIGRDGTLFSPFDEITAVVSESEENP